MERKNNIIICWLFLLFCSCEKQRFLNVPFTETEYVVNGLFSINEACQIEVSKSQYLNDTSAIKNVSTANVLLYENEILIEQLNYLPPGPGKNLGTYKSNFKNFFRARKYSINVEVAGSELISASDIIPNVDIDVSNFSGPSVVGSNNSDLNFELDLKQNNTNKQYFHMLLQQRRVRYNIILSDTNFAFDPWLNKAISPAQGTAGFIPTPSEPFSLIIGPISQGIMLDNENFTNSFKSISFSTRNSFQQLPDSYLESRVIVRLVSANYFKYYFSSSQYYRTKGTPLSEPVIIHNNITNGLGNFSGYYSDTSTVITTFY